MRIVVSSEIETICPQFVGVAVEAYCVNTDYCAELWQEIENLAMRYKATLTPDTLKLIPGIEATRRAYRAFGKDPSRYRPAAEALVRRTLKNKPLYQVNTLVDLINLASMAFGYSIGGFDADRFVGDTLTLGVGRAGEEG